MGKTFADMGLVKSEVPGRTDAHPADVPPGSFVFPADVVSAMGEGNTLAGAKVLKSLLRAPKKGLRGRRTSVPKYADGGSVPIAVAGGEVIASPEEVANLGDGDLERGQAICDMLCRRVRSANIQRLATLPGPKR